MGHLRTSYWTGANDIATEGRWVWEGSGAAVDMSSNGVWAPGVSSMDWIREDMGDGTGRGKLMHV